MSGFSTLSGFNNRLSAEEGKKSLNLKQQKLCKIKCGKKNTETRRNREYNIKQSAYV